MAVNYEAICEENRASYGTKGAQKSGKLAASLYDDRTHFIFELLQNAEDALDRRCNWNGSGKVSFNLNPTRLILSHFGKPFDEADVRSVCDIAESTKNASSIGRFGLGFKSVYTVTDCPEIHSGDLDFAIENYVFPKRIVRSARAVDETQIILPLKPEDVNATQDITTGFRNLGPSSLLFLRNIDEISWNVENGASGFYVRTPPTRLGPNVQLTSVIGQEDDRPEVDQNWLVFYRDVSYADGGKVGRVEIAFSLIAPKGPRSCWAVQPLAKSPLVVFFPTVVESHLGFLVQGPYRTTPSRDNVPPNDPWNQYLAVETAALLVDAMRWMRDQGMLDVMAMRCLPLDSDKFPKNSRFAPMFDAVRQAFQGDALLPTFNGRYTNARQSKLARTQELRELLSPEQIAALFGSEITAWLSGDITQDKNPEIRQYLMRELNIEEITPIKLVPCLTKSFLEAQPDDWVMRLYEFLSGQEKALRPYLDTIPIIRLDDGTHVVAREKGEANAFLPCAFATSLPTMRYAVCATPEIRTFLRTLGITEPDPVDDVIRNILPKYQGEIMDVDEATYITDIDRIKTAFKTDSNGQKEKLTSALRDSNFVMVVDTFNSKTSAAKPGETYIATDRLQQLFANVPSILIVNNEFDCLRGEDIRDLLISCGASRYLMPQTMASNLGHSEKEQIRRKAGLERASWETPIKDFTLRGLEQLLDFMPTLKLEEAKARAKILWEALIDLETARSTTYFYGSYQWGYSHETKTAQFDAGFVRKLNEMSWVPNAEGKLVPPGLVIFDTLNWKSSPFLLTKITFKPPIIDQLAKETGIDPAILDLLRRDPTIVAELASRLRANVATEPISAAKPETDKPFDDDVYINAKDLYGDDMPDLPQSYPNPDGYDDRSIKMTSDGQGYRGMQSSSTSHGNISNNGGSHQGKRIPGQAGGRPFVSYVGTHPSGDEPDPDGLDHSVRMQIEERALKLIISLEPTLCRTPEGNPGFDLFETDHNGKQIRWVEVKSMTGTLKDRPVGLSRTQFDYALEKEDRYWLYVVEHANAPTQTRVLRIQNPVGHARTFTFDHGWNQIAQTKLPLKDL